MPSIADALQNAADALNNAVANVLAIRDKIAAQLADVTNRTNTIINNFNARPLNVAYFVDPDNGNDANDGLTYATAKKTVDGALDVGARGTQGISIFLYGDTTLKQRWILSCNVVITGVQNGAGGVRLPLKRRITFLGLSENSPSSVFGNMSAGINFNAGYLSTSTIDFHLPAIPAGVSMVDHFLSSVATNVNMRSPTITVADQTAANLFASFSGGRLVVSADPTLGAGAAGHIFRGVAANANPNSFLFTTNIATG